MSAVEPPLIKTASPPLEKYELVYRAVSGVVMAVAAIAGVYGGGIFFAAIVAVAAVAALREWHRLINGGPRHGISAELVTTAIAVVIAIELITVQHKAGLSTQVVVAGSLFTSVFAFAHKKSTMLLHMLGAAYIGAPALALVALRQDYAQGGWIVLGLFIAVWAADIGALFFGRLIGGPKLAPALSPSKTWAGFLGGILLATLAEGLYVGLLGGGIANALIFGAVLGFVGHLGDLFESWVKRLFRAKNSGGLIPGHGGMLDRIDSLLFAAPVAATLVFVLHFDPLTGVIR